MAVARVEKMVLITVYEVRPRRRSFSSRHHHHDHHRHHHADNPPPRVNSYDRRAELLHYCQQLRTLGHRPRSSHNHGTNTTNTTTTNKIVSEYAQPDRNPRTQKRLSEYLKRLLLPNFMLKLMEKKKKKKKKKMSESIGATMSALVRSLRAPKKPGFVSKIFAAFRRRR